MVAVNEDLRVLYLERKHEDKLRELMNKTFG